MLGVATVQLKDLLDRPLKKLNDSYARVYDAYIPADELNQ